MPGYSLVVKTVDGRSVHQCQKNTARNLEVEQPDVKKDSCALINKYTGDCMECTNEDKLILGATCV